MPKLLASYCIMDYIKKNYNIELEHTEKTKKALSETDFFDIEAISDALENIKEGNHTLLEPQDKGPETVKTVIHLASKYSAKNLTFVFRTLRKKDLMNSEYFEKFTKLMDTFEHQVDCEAFIAIFNTLAAQFYGNGLESILSLRARDSGILKLHYIIKNLPLFYSVNYENLLSQDNTWLRKAKALMDILSNANLLSDSNLESIWNRCGNQLKNFYSTRSLKVHFELLLALEASALLTQHNLDKLKTFKFSVAFNLTNFNKRNSAKEGISGVSIIIIFIPVIIELYNHGDLKQPILGKILSDVYNILNSSNSPISFLTPKKMKEIPSLSAFTDSQNIQIKVEMIETMDAFFEGTKLEPFLKISGNSADNTDNLEAPPAYDNLEAPPIYEQREGSSSNIPYRPTR